ncbi:colicin immunity domain-containing protein [Actinoplanes sp. NBRC 103695]|uniref:colicin immunity domain-containing protein n=1 Tax=Actinoplanes sp. NBRC 103695 TaxID=3032202 RepID=UPI0024A2D467|nr:colicin immunity domain-containing protein [Actinoplanes sp. NBRC 103695]GLY99910.1 hypothetical protein Acsp02_71630 [Actinoplanes sp. NBRC 103695]
MQGRRDRRRAWSAPSEVEAGTGVARQLRAAEELLAGRVAAPDFAREWLAGRRQALAGGERVREKFERILYDVFYVLDDDYVIDPALRGPGDLTDQQLTDRVRDAVERLRALERHR